MNCTLNDIIAAVCEAYKLPPQALAKRARHAEIAQPRQVVMWIARDMTKLSLPDIGQRLGGFDHTTIIYGVSRVELRMKKDPTLLPFIRSIQRSALKRACERGDKTRAEIAASCTVAA